MKNYPSTTHDKTELCFIRTTVESLVLTYRLFEEWHADTGNAIYSLNVTADDICGYDEESVPFISHSKEEAERIFEILCRGCVTPCTLCDILDDMNE